MKFRLLVVLLSLCTSAFSQTSEELVQSKLNAIHSMTASFNQVVKAKSRIVSNSSGTMALLRPGRFRWQTKDPMEQLVVADGKKLWVYDNAIEQVTVKPQEQGMGGTAALFLSGYNNSVAKDFNVTQRDHAGTMVFDLRSKASKANFQQIKLMFTKDKLTGLELHDQLGQVTTVRLNQIKSNPKLAQSMFQFKPPKGVDVVRQ